MENKATELAKKLKALAERGIGGEKINAEIALKRLLKKHNISLEDIEEETKYRRYIKVPKSKEKLFHQICANVLGRDFSVYGNPRKPGFSIIDLSNSDFLEIEAKYKFYLKCYQEELDVFYLAFVQKNNLFTKGIVLKESEVSQEELDRFERARRIKR